MRRHKIVCIKINYYYSVMQLITNFVYNDPLLVKHIQPLKTVNNIKYLCVSRNSLACKCIRAYMYHERWLGLLLLITDWLWKCHVDQSHRWQGKAMLSSRLINLICFRSWSVTNLMNFFPLRNIKRDNYSWKAMIYAKLCKSGLTIHSILHNYFKPISATFRSKGKQNTMKSCNPF